jgi:hypothetical protein
VYIDEKGILQVGLFEIPCAENTWFGDERYMGKPARPLAEAIAEAFLDLQERNAELEERELALIVREQKMEELKTKCIAILSEQLNHSTK